MALSFILIPHVLLVHAVLTSAQLKNLAVILFPYEIEAVNKIKVLDCSLSIFYFHGSRRRGRKCEI